MLLFKSRKTATETNAVTPPTVSVFCSRWLKAQSNLTELAGEPGVELHLHIKRKKSYLCTTQWSIVDSTTGNTSLNEAVGSD